ncbi:MAG: glycosyltransferase family 39 protein [Candidatus Micrarchaeota archaeon]
MENRVLLGIALFAAISLAGFFLSLYAVSGNAAYWWDEAEYGILSRSMTQNGYFGFFGGPSYRPPMLPVYIAILRGLVGELAWILIIPLFSALSAGAIFILSRKLFGETAAVIASILMLSSSLYIFYSGRLLTEVPGIFFSALSAYFFFKAFEEKRPRDFLLLCLFSLTAFLVYYRFSMMLVSMALFALLFRTKGILENLKPILASLAIFLILLAPLLLYSNSYFGSFIGLFSSSYSGQQPEPLDWFISNIGHIFSNMYVVAFTIIAFIYALAFGQKPIRFLALLTIISFISASVLLNHKEDRYLMPLFPIVFMLIAGFCAVVLEKAYSAIKGFSSAHMEKGAIYISASILVLFLLYQSTLANMGQGLSLFESKKASFGDVKEAALFVRDSTLPQDAVMSDSVTAMFYMDRYSAGFSSSNISYVQGLLESKKPKYLLITAYESRDAYINAINNMKNLKVAANSVEYVFLHPEKFQLEKVFPTETSPYVMVFKII